MPSHSQQLIYIVNFRLSSVAKYSYFQQTNMKLLEEVSLEPVYIYK